MNQPALAPRVSIGISVLATALFTGLMACFLIVIDRTLVTLDAQTYVRIMQELIRNADNPPLVPLMVIASLFSPIATLIFLRKAPKSAAFTYSALALAMALGVLFITVGLNVPINTAISGWSIQAPPADWSAVRDQWHTLNLFRTPVSALGFLFNVLALYALAGEKRQA